MLLKKQGILALEQPRLLSLKARMRGLWLSLELKGSLADHVAVMVALLLPWSTSATGLLVFIWLVALAFKPDVPGFNKSLSSPSGYLPVCLVVLAVAGTFWSDVSITERLHGLQPYYKLLVIPLLITQFRCKIGRASG